jgi:hypothetical protein
MNGQALAAIVRGRLRPAAAILAAFVLAGLVANTSSARPARALCGEERWTVKTLQDRPQLLPVQTTTVLHLTRLRPPASLPPSRLPFEHHVFRIFGAVIAIRPEQDGDLHVILSEGGHTMITEAPEPGCTMRATPLRRAQMARVRRSVRLCRHAVVTGVVFFDYLHGQNYVAPNGIELHPLLSFRCLR